ncbi:AMIN domain-containing protein [Pseudanabaena sp. FACHB-2040]|uniref:AMIN domain-containing protein n=1 Tax=Pseudanabaena sp. FACHB-2040 TaxID=2692859 RepID=UPI0016864C71|nr:AMIN domain-containing protein [Pseudanabaena sp. FACHB-2040]MBD2259762.1 AMIN domain-containing protein [Pseudanabaena sp. FACHB-2040]
MSKLIAGSGSRGLEGGLGLLLGQSLAAAIVFASPIASAAVLSSWDFEPSSQQLSVTLPKGVTPRFLVFAEPARIVLEVPNTQLGTLPTEQIYGGAIRRVQVVQETANTVHVVLELAPNTVIDRRHAELVSAEVGDQTRWTLTPLIVDSGVPIATTPAPAAPLPETATVPMPSPAPAAPEQATSTLPLDSVPTGPRFIETPEGELSIRASNLMLPSLAEGQATLPNTLPVDPFEPSFAPAAQVTVPPLDSTVAVTPNSPQVEVPFLEDTASEPGESAGAIAINPPALTAPLSNSTSLDPADLETTETAPITVIAPPEQTQEPLAASAPTEPVATAEPAAAPQLDLAVEPPQLAPAIASEPAPMTPPAVEVPEPAVATAPANVFVPQVPEVPAIAPTAPAEIVPAPSATLTPSATPEALNQEPPFINTAAAAPQPAAAPDAIVTLPPAAAVSPAAAPLTSTPPVPASAEPVPFLATAPPDGRPASPENVISFGQPLPAATAKEELPSFPYLTPPEANPAANPDVLIPAGTLLQLRYPGPEPLQLDQRSSLDAVMLLAADLRDAKTGALIAPAGSQLMGRFGPDELGLRWVSQAVLLPGRQVPLSGASAYFAGSPQISGQRLAVNSGIGALALTVLTGFTGVGLLGGAMLGATTALGTAPQIIVIEPNQIIEVQILEDVPRSELQLN